LQNLKKNLKKIYSDFINKKRQFMQSYPDPVDNGDLQRFKHLHSWYKHLKLDPPTSFTLVPCQGQQKAHPIHSDQNDGHIHWHFIITELLDSSTYKNPAFLAVLAKHAVPINIFIDQPIRINRLSDGWLRDHNYTPVADYLQQLRQQTSNDAEFLKLYHSTPRVCTTAEDPAPDLSRIYIEEYIFQKEHAQLVQRIRQATRDIWTALLDSGFSPERLNVPIQQIVDSSE